VSQKHNGKSKTPIGARGVRLKRGRPYQKGPAKKAKMEKKPENRGSRPKKMGKKQNGMVRGEK